MRARKFKSLPAHVRSVRAFWPWLSANKLDANEERKLAMARDVPAATNIGEVTRHGLANGGLPPPWQAAQIATRILAKKFKLRLSYL